MEESVHSELNNVWGATIWQFRWRPAARQLFDPAALNHLARRSIKAPVPVPETYACFTREQSIV